MLRFAAHSRFPLLANHHKVLGLPPSIFYAIILLIIMKIKLNGTTIELDGNFVGLTQEMKGCLVGVRKEFIDFDKKNIDRNARISFVLGKKDKILKKLTSYFASIWKIVKVLDKKRYKLYSAYFRRELGGLLLKAEINKYIFDKPLGYSGDYVVMNYIYDYHDDYLGESSYDILINHYTCNIPISNSNIKRNKYFKQQILKALGTIKNPRVVSLGSGPARELIELLDEGAINKPLSFNCVDFEPKALDFVKMEIAKRSNPFLKMDYLRIDIRDVAKAGRIKEILFDIDLAYASGVVDYLSDRFARRLLQVLYGLLNESGQIIIVNASSENSEMRAYYELLGGWVFHHRTKKQLLEWSADLEGAKKIEFEEPFPPNNYLFLKINR